MNNKRIARIAAVAILASLLAACGGGVKGTFQNDFSGMSVTFKGGGKATIFNAMVSQEIETTYEVDGDRIKLRDPEGSGKAEVFTRVDADTLAGPMGMKFKRKK